MFPNFTTQPLYLSLLLSSFTFSEALTLRVVSILVNTSTASILSIRYRVFLVSILAVRYLWGIERKVLGSNGIECVLTGIPEIPCRSGGGTQHACAWCHAMNSFKNQIIGKVDVPLPLRHGNFWHLYLLLCMKAADC